MKSTLGMVLALLTLLELTFSSQVAFAANDITRLVPFQGRLHGGDNKIVSDGTYDLTFYIYETPTGGTSLWTETHPSVSVIHGYVNVLLGAISPMVESNYATQAPLYGEAKNTVNFAQQKYLGISINGGAEMFPRSQLVPTFHAYTANHATHATQADNADNANTLAGYNVSHFATAADISNTNSDINVLEGKFSGEKAKNTDKFDGQDSTYFATAANISGQIAHFLTTSAPVGWLELNGQIVNRAEYPNLWQHASQSGNIGDGQTNFGSGDGATTFKLPDLRGYHLRAWGNGSSVDGGRELASIQADDNKSHNHSASSTAAGAHKHTGNTSNDSHNHSVKDKFVTGENYDINQGIEMRSSSGDLYGQEEFTTQTTSTDTHGHSFSTSTQSNHLHAITVANEGISETRVKNVAAMICIKY